ncbi:photosystem I P700 chlorophyll a apoprotein A1-like [Arachis duranensis]|uniref:Photosystem I P700 chlorophyll a apoprotein A1-like n=2 Tax=Arachis duranensis TaxID=130453 RepID=A0A6P5MEV9_ARADU|nr:photosystem I P700 chlorophyll a apoprotein A1-like [Arachis duranensis]
MIIRSPEPEVKILVDRDPIKTSFEEWAKPGHFSRTIAKGPDTTTWIWNLHADAHDFDSHTSDLEEISQKVFSAHFGQLSIIFLWLSGMYFHGARFSNYEAWLSDPTHIGPSAQVVWPIVGQEILNGDVGGGFRGIQITSGFFQIWRASGITSELQLYCTAIGALVFAALMLFAGWFHYHKAAPKLAWFQDVESMLNHHLAGLLGLGSLSWAGHQVHVSLPINQFLNAGVDPKEIPLPHEFILNRDLLAQLYPSFAEGATPFFTLNWSKYADFLTFRGGLDPVTGGLWLTDIAGCAEGIAEMNQWRLRGKVIIVGKAKFRRQGETRDRPVNVELRCKQGGGPGESYHGKEVATTEPGVVRKPVQEQTAINQGRADSKRLEVPIVKANMEWLGRSLVGKTLKPLDPASLKKTVRANMPHIVDVREIGVSKVLLTFDTVQHADEAFDIKLDTLLRLFHRCDVPTKEGASFRTGRVRVEMGVFDIIREWVQLSVGNSIFRIFVKEVGLEVSEADSVEESPLVCDGNSTVGRQKSVSTMVPVA